MDYEKFLKKAQQRRARIMRLRNSGCTHEEIAKRLGVSRQRIDQIVSEEKGRYIAKTFRP